MRQKRAAATRRTVTPLRRKRLSLDMSLSDLAGKVGVSVAAVSKWETGLGYPEAGMYAKLAKALGLTRDQVADLVFGEVATTAAK